MKLVLIFLLGSVLGGIIGAIVMDKDNQIQNAVVFQGIVLDLEMGEKYLPLKCMSEFCIVQLTKSAAETYKKMERSHE